MLLVSTQSLRLSKNNTDALAGSFIACWLPFFMMYLLAAIPGADLVAPPLLFDVYADPLEEHDLANRHPDIVAELLEVAAAWPTLERPGVTTPLGFLFDPDQFGGPEDREPWVDAAKRRAAEAAD